MKRSNAPLFWVPFGAGGILAALTGPALVFITGVAVPLGWTLPPDLMSYPHVLALAQHGWAKGSLFAVIALYAWHAVHRVFHSLHDLGLHTGATARFVCYGGAFALTVITTASLLSLHS